MLYYIVDYPIDLTPFGFTPTETIAYGALLNGGPSSGYAIAKRLSIARANAYQALDGLVKKGAAEATEERPKRYRAARPDAMLARIVAEQSRKLDVLEAQVAQSPDSDTNLIAPIEGSRAIVDLAMRAVAREEGPVECLGPVGVVTALSPAWRKRALDGRNSRIWLIGAGSLPSSEPHGRIPEEPVRELFGSLALLLTMGEAVIVARIDDTVAAGYWASDPAIAGAVKGTIAALKTSN